MLSHYALREHAVTGLAVMCVTSVAEARVSQRLISALSAALWELGDVAHSVKPPES